MGEVVLTVSFSKYLSDMIDYCTDTCGLYKNTNEFVTESVRSLMFDVINEEVNIDDLRQRLKMIIKMDEGACYEYDISLTNELYQYMKTVTEYCSCDVNTFISMAVNRHSTYADDFISNYDAAFQ